MRRREAERGILGIQLGGASRQGKALTRGRRFWVTAIHSVDAIRIFYDGSPTTRED